MVLVVILVCVVRRHVAARARSDRVAKGRRTTRRGA